MEDYRFQTVQEAGEFLKQEIEKDLIQCIKTSGHAVLILPGGNSIKLFFPYLISINAPWDKITIGLTDERCVSSDHEMSNERQLKQYFLDFLPNYNYCSLNEELLAQMQGFPTITILSMGKDGHVASLFPEEAQDWKNKRTEIFKTKKQNPNRISLTEGTLLQASKIYMLVVGEEKNKFIDTENLFLSPLRSVYKKSIWIRY